MSDELKRRSQLVWSTGDYSPTSTQLEPASAALVEALGVTSGHRVLDVAAGHGNCAIAAARRGAAVTASDFSPTMIEVGHARTTREGLAIQWQEADAAALPFEDNSFDRVTSVFGAIFAPEQERTAAELVRVTRDDGRIGLTAWTPDGYTARLLALTRSFGPPVPADAPDPMRWGRPDEVAALFGELGWTVDVARRTVTFRYDSWEHWRAASEAHGMAVVAKQMLPPERYEEMYTAVRGLAEDVNRATGDAVEFDADYVELIVTKA